MAATNDITGDRLTTKVASDAYRDNFEKIFPRGKVVLGESESAVETPIEGEAKVLVLSENVVAKGNF